jgi:hypothetical protein
MLVAVAACSHHAAAPSTASAVPTPTMSPVTSASPSTAATGTASASASPTTPLCTTAQLRLSVHESDAGAGQFHQRLVLTNRGVRCSLQGYPGVSFLDAAGQQLGSPAARGTAPHQQVFLDPGTSAAAVLTYSNAGAFPDSSCRPQQADRVRVYPPGQRTALLAKDAILVCSAPGAGQLHIGPLEAFAD